MQFGAPDFWKRLFVRCYRLNQLGAGQIRSGESPQHLPIGLAGRFQFGASLAVRELFDFYGIEIGCIRYAVGDKTLDLLVIAG